MTPAVGLLRSHRAACRFPGSFPRGRPSVATNISPHIRPTDSVRDTESLVYRRQYTDTVYGYIHDTYVRTFTIQYSLDFDALAVHHFHAPFVVMVLRDVPANMSVIFTTAVFFITEYTRSGNRLPASMLSVTHSGRTTCTMCLDLVVKNFCVFEPFSCCDVKMCVAPDAVFLHRIVYSSTADTFISLDKIRHTAFGRRRASRCASSRCPSYCLDIR